MLEIITSLFLGIILIFVGVSNMKGNISSIHSYHRKRVNEEDRIPFGRKVGIGTIIIGCSVIILSIMSVVTYFTNISIFTTIGYIFLILGLAVGLAIGFYAIIKYNKGIF